MLVTKSKLRSDKLDKNIIINITIINIIIIIILGLVNFFVNIYAFVFCIFIMTQER